MKRLVTPLAFTLVATTLAGTPALAAGEVNVYSYRQEFLIRPFLDRFTASTGTKVNVVFAKKGMLERLKAEGMLSPADLVLTVDISRLDALAKAGLLQQVYSSKLAANTPKQFRHPGGLWWGLTWRARLIYTSKERVKPGEIKSYEDLADPKWKGRICMRSSKHVYNRALLASMIAAHGEAKAAAWVKGLKANLARKPQGNDRAQVKAIKEGLCDVALGNNYYYGKMKFNEKKPEQKTWAGAVNLLFPNGEGRGTHVNISGVAMTKSSKNRSQALALMEFLSGEVAQKMYASMNYEYPVNPRVAPDPEVASWGVCKPDSVSLQKIADLSPRALRMFNEVGFE
ncbi:MAG: Fe(3+) ABC transporter substrate-binding protein [Alphaproteobacteria bacterium]|jgi:iron(III) transport system substrate-binding protein|nr:Fe(3+) ABC transporter substrate-binding protein [Alphaproteobacteria bacterium]